MSIKQHGGVFGRNPTFNDLTVEGDLTIDGTLSIGGETITGLSYQGGWNASTNSPDIAASSPVTGQFWIVSTGGSTDVGGITNWTSGDWALYDGSNWQRVEGGTVDLSSGVTGTLPIANGGTGSTSASDARTALGLGTIATQAASNVDIDGGAIDGTTIATSVVVESLNAQTGTSYTLVASDASKLITLNNAASITLTVPTNASVAFAVGTTIDIVQTGAGQVTVSSSATLRATPGAKLRDQYSAGSLIKIATDEWVLIGDLTS